MKTLCRSNLPAPRLRQAGEVEVRDGVRSQRQSSLVSVTTESDRKKASFFASRLQHEMGFGAKPDAS